MSRSRLSLCAAFLVIVGIGASGPAGLGRTKPPAQKPGTSASLAGPAFDFEGALKAYRARNIGPGIVGGRTVDIAVPDRNTSIIYAAVGPSGLWKSSNAGTTGAKIRNAILSISVSPLRKGIIWIGTDTDRSRSPARTSRIPTFFAGSEFGLFFSFDGGKKWIPYKTVFPTVAVRDIQVHPREHDLLIATHGRGVWIMDVIRALEQLKPETLKDESALFDVRYASIYGNMAVLLDVDAPALNKILAEKDFPFISIP